MDNIMKEGQSMMDSGNSNQSSDQSSDMQSSGSDNSSGGRGMMESMKQNGENAYVHNEANDMMDKAGVPEGIDSKVDSAIDGGMKKFQGFRR